MHLLALLLLTSLTFATPLKPADGCESSLRSETVAHHHADLDSYIAGMEKSSLQKAAMGALGRPGRLVDLGAGSGVSAYDLAVLFPDSKVVGVDLDPAMVKYAREHYSAPNLKFKVGDAERPNFKPESLDTIFISSTTHHLTSYGTGTFDVEHVHNAIRAAREQLRDGGVFILRDFVIGDGPEDVMMELPTTDGATSGPVPELSSAALFEKFAVDFRSSQHPVSGVPYKEFLASEVGWRAFKLKARDAGEFILRKDYRASYEAEIKEEYTFMTKVEFEAALETAGFRVLHSAPLSNPWIVENRYRDKVRFFNMTHQRLPLPPTNFVIAAEKIPDGQGLRLTEAFRNPQATPTFLRPWAVRDRKTDQVFDLIERPGAAVDLLPYFLKGPGLFVMAKQGYPRPLTTVQESPPLDGVRPQGYMIEPLSFLVDGGEPLFRQIETQLAKRGGIDPAEILSQGPQVLSNLYSSPGLVNEKAQTIALPVRTRALSLSYPEDAYSGFSTSGVVRSLEATQLLRSAQVGALLDARLELGVYQLLLSLGRKPGPWIGEEVKLGETRALPRVQAASTVLDPKRKERRFVSAPESEFGTYLEIRRSDFEEEDAGRRTINSVSLEYAVPKDFGVQVMSVLPVMRKGSKILVGLEARQMPTVQMNEGTSNLVTAPAWRLPKTIKNMDAAKDFVTAKMNEDLGVRAPKLTALGGMYHPSKGVVPEAVFPFLAEVDSGGPELQWVELGDLVASRALIKDAQLMIVLLRAAHALGAL